MKGQISTLLFEAGASSPGRINPNNGNVTLAKKPGANTYDLFDELAGLTIRSGGNVLPTKRGQISGDSPVAALFRYRI